MATHAGTTAPADPPRRMIVLGVDGMDPGLLREYLAAGILPNLARLADSGGFVALGTSFPPLSPVAWSSFITGLDPGGHGIFDFIELNRQTLQGELSVARVEWLGFNPIAVRQWRIPLGTQRLVPRREGVAFWELLDRAGVPAILFQVPANYPPVRAGAGSISGMGTPDLLGTSGTYAVFTDDPRTPAGRLGLHVINRVALDNGTAELRLDGPPNALRAGEPQLSTAFRVSVDPDHAVALVDFGGERALVREGEWSEWLRVRFELVPGLVGVSGMVQVLLQSARPHLRLLVSPIHIDPRDPAQPIAYPRAFGPALAAATGPFSTKEMPDAAKALQDGLLTPGEFLVQSGRVLDERRRLLAAELARFSSAAGDRFLFFYISSLDLRHHMLAHHLDPAHPRHDSAAPLQLLDAMRNTYREVDELVGWVLAAADEHTTVAVMSDHGFASFRRQANVNVWLEAQGFLRHRNPPDQRDALSWLEGIDWSQTRAFAAGMNGIHINVQGRERFGIVPPTERDAVARGIVRRLLQWRDPVNRATVVTRAQLREEAYTGPHVDRAPDVIIGFARGYRMSWDSAIGRVLGPILEDNRREWTGDHGMDPAAVPGVLLVNRPLRLVDPDLKDMPVTILHHYGIAPPAAMQGRVIF